MMNIMMATDFSERSDRALRRTTLLARRFEASMTLVHVVDDDQPRRIVEVETAEAEKLLHELAGTVRGVDGLGCSTRLLEADPFAGIVQASKDEPPDLLVIGPHRRQLLKDAFAGTTAERTIRSVACPVLMVNAPPVGEYRHVLQTSDLSDGSRVALQRFGELPVGEHARNSILYVFDAPALRLGMRDSMSREEQARYLEDEKREAARELSDFMTTAKLRRAERILRYEETAVPNEILKAAAGEEVDLIVLATHGRSGLAKLFLGSVTQQVLRVSPVDVLAIPPAREA